MAKRNTLKKSTSGRNPLAGHKKKRTVAVVKGSLNKSEAIRTYAADHPEAKPKEIAAKLETKHGVPFTAAQVSTTLSNAKKKGTAGSPKGKAKSGNAVVPVSSIELAGKLLKDCGSKENAIALLKAIG